MIHRSVSSLSPVKPLGSGIGALNCRSPWGQTGAALWLQRGPHTHTNLHHYLSLYLRSLLSSCLVKPPPPPLFPSLHFPEGMIDSHTLSTDTLTATAQPLWYVGWGVCVCVCVRRCWWGYGQGGSRRVVTDIPKRCLIYTCCCSMWGCLCRSVS